MFARRSIFLTTSAVAKRCCAQRAVTPFAAAATSSFSSSAAASPKHDHSKDTNKVTVAQAKQMPACYAEMPNDIILNMAVNGDQEAREERLIRCIMATDNVSWEQAQPQFLKIVASNRRGLFMATVPYKIGIAAAVIGGFASIPMIFHLDTVMWFNEHFVTTDVPDDKDLETPLEVGGWAWNWMEPPLGQISFFLLCMQYSRSQMQNLGIKPYTEWFLNRRAERVCNEFPQYSRLVITSFSEGESLSPSDPTENK